MLSSLIWRRFRFVDGRAASSDLQNVYKVDFGKWISENVILDQESETTITGNFVAVVTVLSYLVKERKIIGDASWENSHHATKSREKVIQFICLWK